MYPKKVLIRIFTSQKKKFTVNLFVHTFGVALDVRNNHRLRRAHSVRETATSSKHIF